MKFTIIALLFLVACGHKPQKQQVVERKLMVGNYFIDTTQRMYSGQMVLTVITALEPVKGDSLKNEYVTDSLWQYFKKIDSLKSKIVPTQDSNILIQIPKTWVIKTPVENKYIKH